MKSRLLGSASVAACLRGPDWLGEMLWAPHKVPSFAMVSAPSREPVFSQQNSLGSAVGATVF